jgi:hypothetical protein
MKKTITKQLQEMMSDYVSDVEMKKLEGIFKAYENLEISRYRSAYAVGRCDVITFAKRSTDQFINENYETNE